MNIYIHIPFCRSKCAYCAFLSVSDLKKQDEYFRCLQNEIRERIKKVTEPVETIYFGGGTPSIVDTGFIKNIINEIPKQKVSKNLEITLESNPEDITLLKLQQWKSTGINRLSIGIQSLDDKVRKGVGRNLTAKEALEKILLAKAVFERVGVDLIAGLPVEKIGVFLKGIERIVSLGVTHISLYDLEINECSAIGKNISSYALLNESERTNMLSQGWDLLERLGFEQYEISNFAKNQDVSKHNLAFWHGKDYLGFGLGAVSRIDNVVYINTSDFTEYFKGDFLKSTERISLEEALTFKVAALIRLNEPLNTFIEDSDKLLKLQKLGLINENCFVTHSGKMFNDYLLKELL